MKRKKTSPKAHAKFTEREDDNLSQLVEEYGDNNWDIIAEQMKGRNKRQCKERWINYLSPSLNMNPWTEAEDNLLQEKYKEYGSKWVIISKFFKNRTDTMVKNRFQLLRRRDLRQERRNFRKSQREKLQELDVKDPETSSDQQSDKSFEWSKIENDTFEGIASFFGAIDDIFQ